MRYDKYSVLNEVVLNVQSVKYKICAIFELNNFVFISILFADRQKNGLQKPNQSHIHENMF